MSKLHVNEIVEATAGHGIHIPGHVVQTQYVQCGTAGNSIGITATDVWIDIPEAILNFTPKSPTSKILIETYHHCYVGGAASASVWSSANLRVLVDNTQVSIYQVNNAQDYYFAQFGGDDNRAMGYGNESLVYSTGSTTPIEIKIQTMFRYGDGSGSFIRINQFGRGMLKVTEIAQ